MKHLLKSWGLSDYTGGYFHIWSTTSVIRVLISKPRTATPTSEARKLFLRNPRILLSISLLWLPCMFLFPLKFRWLQRLLLNETMDVSSWNVGHVLKTAWKWSSWSLIWEQDGTNVSFISHIHMRFLSRAISVIVLLTLPSPSSAVLLSNSLLLLRGKQTNKQTDRQTDRQTKAISLQTDWEE